MKSNAWLGSMPTFNESARIHVMNLVGAPVLMALVMVSITRNLWIVVPLALFTGAAVHNSVVGLMVGRDMQKWRDSL